MARWKLNGCPHCSGDLFVGIDRELGWYETCIQCGYNRLLIPVPRVLVTDDRVTPQLPFADLS
jgi:hypothetical protein